MVNVKNANYLSDHCVIKLKLKLNYFNCQEHNYIVVKPLNTVYKWNEGDIELFADMIKSPLCMNDINNILNYKYTIDQESVNTIDEDLTHLFQKAAQLCLKRKKTSPSKKKHGNFKFKNNDIKAL